MPVFGACFLLALFAVMQRYKDCLNEQKEMPAFIPFLVSIYIMYARTFIISYLKYRYLLPFPRSSLFSSFSTSLIFCEFAPNRPAARKFANYGAFKIPLSVLVQTFALLFLALYSSALFCSVFPCRLIGQIPASFPASFPCSLLSTFLR